MRSKTHARPQVRDRAIRLPASFDYSERVARNPYGMLAAALGIGFVLGGGLFTRVSAGIFSAGLRIALMAALPVAQKELARLITENLHPNPPNTKE